MEIAVDGWRAGTAERDSVRNLPVEQLPQLTEEQRAVARKLGISEQDYARNVVAGERSRETLLTKTERLARLLEQRIVRIHPRARVNRVTLRTIEDRFDVDLQVDGKTMPLRIRESLVDDYFDAGSPESEARLGRVLDRALLGLPQ